MLPTQPSSQNISHIQGDKQNVEPVDYEEVTALSLRFCAALNLRVLFRSTPIANAVPTGNTMHQRFLLNLFRSVTLAIYLKQQNGNGEKETKL